MSGVVAILGLALTLQSPQQIRPGADSARPARLPPSGRAIATHAVYGDTSVTNHPGGFNFKEFQSNLVFRWEYQPGSVLFVVWNEGRQGSTSAEGNADFGGDVRDLLRLHPASTVLVKMSYWLNW
jgi:Domain of unknown function (DUF5916)